MFRFVLLRFVLFLFTLLCYGSLYNVVLCCRVSFCYVLFRYVLLRFALLLFVLHCFFLLSFVTVRYVLHCYVSFALLRFISHVSDPGFAGLRMWRQALTAFTKAKSDGVPLTSATYTQAINAMSKGGRFEKITRKRVAAGATAY